MTNHSQKLYWTADSPFSRIVLWALAENGHLQNTLLIHLGWDELKSASSAHLLSEEATVPCLYADGRKTADSLRILALADGDTFVRWLTSADGALYRCAEGQLGQVMYALYNGGAPGKTLELWHKALTSAESLLKKSLAETQAQSIGKGQMAVHTFISFCVFFRPELRDTISDEMKNALSQFEKSDSFARMRACCESQSCRVPCGGLSAGISVCDDL